MAIDAALRGPLVVAGAEGVAVGAVQLLPEGGGLALVQVPGQDQEPERSVAVDLLVAEHRGNPAD